jgi:hypothetical protein
MEKILTNFTLSISVCYYFLQTDRLDWEKFSLILV